MKMPEKHDLLAAILAAKEQGTGQLLRLQWRTAADIRRCVYKKTVIDATMCAIIVSSFVTFSTSLTSSKSAI